MRHLRIQISPIFCIYLCIVLLLFPIKRVISWIIAAAFHELCHAIVIKSCGLQIDRVQLHIGGATIHTQISSSKKELICAIAGPIGSALLLLFIRVWPELSFCGLVQCVFNLLPIYPLDGGRALRCLVELIVGKQQLDIVMLWVDRITLSIISILSVYVSLQYEIGLLPIIVTTTLILKRRNIACKPPHQRVQ